MGRTPGRGAPRPRGGKPPRGAPPPGPADIDDDVDAFHRDKDVVSLRGAGRDDDDSEDDDEEDEEALDLGDAADDGDEESDSEEDEEDEEDEEEEDDDDEPASGKPRTYEAKLKAQARMMRAKQLAAQGEDEDEDEEDEEDDEEPDNRWGAKKRAYYDADIPSDQEDEEEAARDEEREALRLQRKAAAALRPEDFGAGEEDDDDEEEEDDDEDDEDDEDDGELPMGAAARRGAAVERLGKERGGKGLSESQRAAAVLGDAPELLALVNELKGSLDEVRTRVQPVLTAVRAGEHATADGVSYLEAKHLLLLSYCTNIVFYLLLKAEGRPVKDHPVIERLVELRTYIEKTRPIDKKLQYQMDKLVKLAAEPLAAAAANGAADGADPLSFRPNPEALVSKDDKRGEDDDNLYRPVKMLPTAMDGEGEDGRTAKERRREKEMRRRAARSQLVRDLATEVDEVPEELREDALGETSAFARREEARMAKRAAIEEDNFMRVPLSRLEKKRLKGAQRAIGMATQVKDFGDDVTDIVEMAHALDEGSRKRPRLSELAGRAAHPHVGGRVTSGDADLPARESLGDKRARFARQAAARAVAEDDLTGADRFDDGDDGVLEEDDFYKEALAAQRARKSARAEKYAGPAPTFAGEEEQADGKRLIGRDISANRGLTPHRKKEIKNPRKHARIKHAKAVVRRKGQVRAMRTGEGGGYGGEASGIKSNVTKSRRIGT